MARSSRLRGCWVVLGAVGLAGRSSRRQGQLAGAVPPSRPVDRPAWRDGVSHVVTPPTRLDQPSSWGTRVNNGEPKEVAGSSIRNQQVR